MLRLEKGNSADIGFIAYARSVGAISWDEFKDWIYYIIETNDVNDLPSYIFEVASIDDHKEHAKREKELYGFRPGLVSSNEDDDFRALHGIAYLRNPKYKSAYVSRKKALAALALCPHVQKQFKELLPFISVQWNAVDDEVTK